MLIALTALACSASSARRIDSRADATAQEVREDSDEIPCEARLILQTICQQCHTSPPQNGAPFPLVRRTDVLMTRSGGVVRELMVQQLEAKRMPLTPVTIDDEAREVLLDWLRAGAPAVSPRRCEDGLVSDGGSDSELSDSSTEPPPADACAGTCNQTVPDAGSDAAGTDAHVDGGPE